MTANAKDYELPGGSYCIEKVILRGRKVSVAEDQTKPGVEQRGARRYARARGPPSARALSLKGELV